MAAASVMRSPADGHCRRTRLCGLIGGDWWFMRRRKEAYASQSCSVCGYRSSIFDARLGGGRRAPLCLFGRGFRCIMIGIGPANE